MNDYPATVIRVMELAQQRLPSADLPPELGDALTFRRNKSLVHVADSVCVGMTSAKTIKKKAHALRPGDVIRLQEEDDRGYAVEQVEVHTHTVDVWGMGRECRYRYAADVTVFDGPPPQPIYSKSTLVLLPEGEAALAFHRMTAGAGSKREEEKGQQGESSTTGITRQDVAERLERLRVQGQAFTSQQKLAKQLGCSSATINKAIGSKPLLQKWAERKAAEPRAQSLSDVVIDRTAQSTETDPQDDAAIREYLERDLKPGERAFFNGLSRKDQLFFLDDPDKRQKILGRKP